jgi:mannose-1-phosphate guanylyltransferase
VAKVEKTSLPALLLAAGKGTRLGALGLSQPKCLLPIAGHPLLDFWLSLCVQGGSTPIIVNTHHLAEQVRAHVQASPWAEQVSLRHEDELLGTGGTLLACRHLLDGGPFLVAHADNLSLFSLHDFWQAHQQRPYGCIMTMMLFETPTPESCGIVELDELGRVRAFHEKVPNPPGNLANGAVYIMEPEAFDILAGCGNPRPDLSLDLIPKCLNRIAVFENKILHIDIGTQTSYALAQQKFPLVVRACSSDLRPAFWEQV